MNWTPFWITVGVIIGIIVLFFGYGLLFMIQGFGDQKTIPCKQGQCIMTADGTKKICPPDSNPNQVMVPNYKFALCIDSLSCPQAGIKYAVHADGSALTGTCDVAG